MSRAGPRSAGLLVLVALGLALVWFERHPLRLPAAGPRIAATVTDRDRGHPVLLLIDGAGLRGARPDRLAGRWSDLEWDNLLTQAYGGCDVADLARLAEVLERRSLVVVPRRSASALSAEHLDRLDAAVAAGLHVLVEAPDSTLCQRFGLELAAVERRPLLPWPQDSGPRPGFGAALRPTALDLAWTRFRYAPPPLSIEVRPTVHLSLDGRPLGWVSARGKGSWVVLAMDFGELATRLRQGAPAADLRLRPRAADAAVVSTADLSASADLLSADDAWLDAWVEGVFGAALTPTPLPRLATAPWDADGWLLVSTRTLAPDTCVARFAAVTDSVFAAGTRGLASAWPGPGPVPEALSRRVGAAGLRPLLRLAGVDTQRRELAARSGEPVLLNRNQAARWTEDPDLAFAMLVGAGFGIDTSFGGGAGAAGWLFGSGVPFTPLATDGRAFGLREVVVHAGLAALPGELRRVERWLRHNASGGASPVHLLVDDDDALATLERLATAHGHRRSRPDELVRWWERRSTVLLRSQAIEDGLEIRIEDAGDEGLALLVPLRWRDRGLAGWEADWGHARSRRVQRFDRAYRVFELAAAADGGTLRLHYR